MGKRGAKVEFSDSVLSSARRIIDGLTYRDDILMAFSILLTAGGMGWILCISWQNKDILLRWRSSRWRSKAKPA